MAHPPARSARVGNVESHIQRSANDTGRRRRPTRDGRRSVCNCFRMVLSLEQIVIDARDPRALGHWWARALGWIVTLDEDDEFEIRPAADVTPGLLFVPVADDRVVKNRLHLDFSPDDQAAEVQRLLDLGAVRADVGQSDVSWVVLRDPEGNDFCVLGSRYIASGN